MTLCCVWGCRHRQGAALLITCHPPKWAIHGPYLREEMEGVEDKKQTNTNKKQTNTTLFPISLRVLLRVLNLFSNPFPNSVFNTDETGSIEAQMSLSATVVLPERNGLFCQTTETALVSNFQFMNQLNVSQPILYKSWPVCKRFGRHQISIFEK